VWLGERPAALDEVKAVLRTFEDGKGAKLQCPS